MGLYPSKIIILLFFKTFYDLIVKHFIRPELILVYQSVIPCIKFTSTNLYTWAEKGTVRVKCLAQEHNFHLTMARVWTRISTYHKATGPPLPYHNSCLPLKLQCLLFICFICFRWSSSYREGSNTRSTNKKQERFRCGRHRNTETEDNREQGCSSTCGIPCPGYSAAVCRGAAAENREEQVKETTICYGWRWLSHQWNVLVTDR